MQTYPAKMQPEGAESFKPQMYYEAEGSWSSCVAFHYWRPGVQHRLTNFIFQLSTFTKHFPEEGFCFHLIPNPLTEFRPRPSASFVSARRSETGIPACAFLSNFCGVSS
jgi:hypothetical protein